MEIPTFEIRDDDKALGGYSRGYQAFGARPLQALDLAKKAAIRLCEKKFENMIRASVGYYAKMYLESFGDLRGFDAERVAQAYIPYDKLMFMSGGEKPGMRRLFTEMRREGG